MYKRVPQGFFAAGDAYTRLYDEIIDGVERKVKIVDDTLLYDNPIEQAFYHVWDYLTLCTNNGVVTNAKKFKFCQDTVDFAGLALTSNGVIPSEKTFVIDMRFPYTNRPYRCPIMVWTCQSSRLGLCHQPCYATVP